MKQKLSAVFFLLIFTSLISAPTVLMVIDDSIDISCFYTINEEEEEKGHEIIKEGKMFYNESVNISDYIKGINELKEYVYFFKSYPKPHLNLISPPPEFTS